MAVKSSPMKESAIQRQIINYLKDQGFLVWKISDRFRAGIPDLYAARDGRSIWFEVKAPGGSLSKLQGYELAQLCGRRIEAHVVHSVDEVRVVIAWGTV